MAEATSSYILAYRNIFLLKAQNLGWKYSILGNFAVNTHYLFSLEISHFSLSFWDPHFISRVLKPHFSSRVVNTRLITTDYLYALYLYKIFLSVVLTLHFLVYQCY